MKVSATTLQRLVDERGADLRTIVLDDCGQVVGVGQRTKVRPAGCARPSGPATSPSATPTAATPVRRADLDHLCPWPDGPTDVANLSPVGRRWHNAKTSTRWTVRRARDGTVTWRHRRHGWRIRLAPPRRDLTDVPDPGPPRLPLDDPARARSRLTPDHATPRRPATRTGRLVAARAGVRRHQLPVRAASAASHATGRQATAPTRAVRRPRRSGRHASSGQ